MSSKKLTKKNVQENFVPNLEDNENICQIISNSLKIMEGLVLAYVITKNNVFKTISDKSKQIPKVKSEQGKQDITQDDITNLIIDIERAKSVDDLL